MLNPVGTQSRNRQYSRRFHDIKHGTFTSLIFTTTGEMDEEYLSFQELMDLIEIKYLRLFYSAVTMGSYPFPKQSYSTN